MKTDSNIAGQRAKRPEFDERCPVERERAVWAVNRVDGRYRHVACGFGHLQSVMDERAWATLVSASGSPSRGRWR